MFMVPVGQLIFMRARPEGIANGARLMRAAYDGQHSRRNPISVRPFRDGYLVQDGNSTALNAIASGWPEIACVNLSDTAPDTLR